MFYILSSLRFYYGMMCIVCIFYVMYYRNGPLRFFSEKDQCLTRYNH